MIDSITQILREVNREHLHRIWEKAKIGEMEGLDEEEQRLAKVMLEHANEFFNQFEFADVLADHPFDPEKEINPFLHITIHAVAEKQIQERDPIEALQFYNAMLKQKCSRHDAIHLLGLILLKFITPVLKGGGRFSLKDYRNLLKKYKVRKPEKIPELLEKEPGPMVEMEIDRENLAIFNEIDSALKDRNFRSIEEIQSFIDDWVARKNAEPIPEFLGFSPEQMYRVLHQPFSEVPDILTFNRNLSKEDLLDAPIVKETMTFLKRLSELQPLKATSKGNLPQAFAREMHQKFSEPSRYDFTIRSEEEDRKLSALRHLLEMMGWIKKRNKKFSLTQKGERVAQNGLSGDDFCKLLETYARRFNWAFRDLYPPFEIIQEGFLFSCYLLKEKAKRYIPAHELSNYFIQAFPTVVEEVRGISCWEPEEEVSRTFSLRFIERFCEYFGFVMIQREEGSYNGYKNFVKTTPLFEKMFLWNIGSTGGG